MGIAALIIGIVAVVLGFIPFCGWFALLPAVVGLALGIAEISVKSKKEQPKGMGIAGLVLNGVAIVVILVWTLVIAAGATKAAKEAKAEMEAAGVTNLQQMIEEAQEVSTATN
ncbi:MAG: hypothetical protein R6V03_07660 [Kiritimatiellia bacterium]